WVRAHCLEVEDLQAVHGQRVSNVVKHVRVSSAFNPLVEARADCPRKQARQRKQPALPSLQDEQVFHGLINLAILADTEAIAVVAFDQDARECMKKVNLFWRRQLDVEWIDCYGLPLDA